MTESVAEEIRTLQSLVWSERDPDGRGFASLADAHRRGGEPRKAFEILSEGLARLPAFASGHVVAARLYVEQGLFAEGELAARRALELDPDNVSAMASLVKALEGAGTPDRAAETRATLAALEPEILREEGLEPEGGEDGLDEDVMDIALLGPDVEDDPVLDVGTLAPDSVTLETPEPDPLEADLPEEELVLGPDARGEPVFDIAALGPDPVDDAAVFDIAALGPDPADDEAVFDIAALGPDPADDEAVFDIATLQPDATDDDLVIEVTALEPDSHPALPEGDLVLDVASLGPDAQDDEPVLEVTALEPDLPEDDLELEVPEPAPAPRDPREGAPRIYTRTLGELYAKQGFTDRAADVFRHLLAENPGDAALAGRLEELERAMPTPDVQSSRPERDEELEEIARDLTMNRDVHPEVESPFAWADEPEEDVQAPDGGATVREYFGDLLSWRTGREA